MHIKQISSYPELHFERNHDGYDLQQEFNFLTGNWLFGKLGDLAQAVNSRLGNNGISLKRKS